MMGRSRLALWFGLTVAALAGVGVAAYLAWRQERERDQLQQILERSQQIVHHLESELLARAALDTTSSRA